MTKKAELTTEQKAEALQNSLKYFGFPLKYFIHYAKIGRATKFVIAYKDDVECTHYKTPPFSYEELNAFILGYVRASQKLLG